MTENSEFLKKGRNNQSTDELNSSSVSSTIVSIENNDTINNISSTTPMKLDNNNFKYIQIHDYDESINDDDTSGNEGDNESSNDESNSDDNKENIPFTTIMIYKKSHDINSQVMMKNKKWEDEEKYKKNKYRNRSRGRYKKYRRRSFHHIKKKKVVAILLGIVLVQCLFGYLLLNMLQVNNFDINKIIKGKTNEEEMNENKNMNIEDFSWRYQDFEKKMTNTTIHNRNDGVDLNGFVLLKENNPRGPITIDRDQDDGTKLDIFSMIYSKTKLNQLIKNYNNYQNMKEKIEKEEYLCDFEPDGPLEGQDGYTISCPVHYTLSVNYTFYGRYNDDVHHCNTNKESKNKLLVTNKCGYQPLEEIQQICDGKQFCILNMNSFNNQCKDDIIKYLHINYQCVKDKTFKNEDRFAVVMFTNKINVNSVYENSVSEFYQYCRYYGYGFYLYRNRYDYGRTVYFMKLEYLIETMTLALKENKYEWIFWVDSDSILSNPNIELNAFIPPTTDKDIHFICSDDFNGLNNGVFFLRVHPWSLNFLIRSLAYSYYNPKKILTFWEQTSMNNVLTEFQESKHYIIVPQTWFNSYINKKNIGDFLIHLAGMSNKDEEAQKFREQVKGYNWHRFKSNEEMRSEVLEYYALPKEDQHVIQYQ